MVQGLWTLSRGSVDDKLRWAFTLYDLDGDGQICRDEMTRVVTAVYELMGKFAEPWLKDGTTVAAHVDFVFQVTRSVLPLQRTRPTAVPNFYGGVRERFVVKRPPIAADSVSFWSVF